MDSEKDQPEEEYDEEEEDEESDDSRNYKAIEIEKDGQKTIKYVRKDRLQ